MCWVSTLHRMSRGRSLVAMRVSLFLYHSVFIGTYHCHGYGAVAVGVTSKEEEGGEAMGTHLECMPTRGTGEEKMEQVIEAVSMSAPIFVATVKGAGA